MSHFFRKYFYYAYSVLELLTGIENPLQVISIFLKKPSSDVKIIRLRQSKLQFKLRGAMDVWSIKETFIDRFYEVYGFAIQPGWVVMDIGAGLGEYTLFAAQTPKTRVFGFEPFPESFALLQENIQLNKTQNIRAFEEAVGAQSGTLTLDLSSGEPLQFQSQDGSAPVNEKRLTVKSISLVDVFKKLEINACDLIKLDCEGAEYDILFNTPPEMLQRIDHFVMEYHDNTTKYNHTDLSQFLEKQGFQVDVYSNPVHSYLGYMRAKRKK